MSYDVICPGCKKSYHETNELFIKDQTTTGAMLRLKKKYGPRGANWSSFPNNTSMKCGDLECPSCGAPYCSGGSRVVVRDQVAPDNPPPQEVPTSSAALLPDSPKPPNDAWVCEDCGKVCASKAGLGAHQRHCKGK